MSLSVNKDVNHKKICFVVQSLQLGGLENSASIMANFFSEKGCKVHFLTMYNFPHFYKLDDIIEISDPPFDRKGKNKIFYYLKIITHLRRKIKTISPEKVLAFGDWSNILVLMSCLGLKTKVIISDRASPELTFQWYVRLLRRSLYPKAYGIIAQTDRAAKQKRKMLGRNLNVKVIPNPVKSIELFPGIKRENYILGVGRHYPVKGFDRLLKAFSSTDRGGYKLLIAGSHGPASADLHEIVEKLNLKSDVVFLGSVTEMDKLYAKCKIFVLPSRSEGFPNALIESMAAGLACISFNCPAGPREIITHGEDGILVENHNIRELTAQIQYLINNNAEIIRLGKNALKIRERLSLEKIGKQYMDFILN